MPNTKGAQDEEAFLRWFPPAIPWAAVVFPSPLRLGRSAAFFETQGVSLSHHYLFVHLRLQAMGSHWGTIRSQTPRSDVHFQEVSPLPQEGARLEAGTLCEAILWIWAENDRAVMGETKAVGKSMFTTAAEDGDAAQS